MKTTKRILALLLTFCMLATVLCLPAFAVEEGETATLEDADGDGYLEIATAADFLLIANDLTANYELTADIVSDEIIHLGAFKGILDGGYHTVTIKGTYTGSSSYGMLFSSLNGATIKNIQIGTEEIPLDYDRTAHTKGWNAGVLGSNASGKVTISNVSIWVDVDFTQKETTAGNFGVFFGKIDSASAEVTFENCVANGEIYSENQTKANAYAGFVGSASQAVSIVFKNCTNNTNIQSTTTTSLLTAGFVGKGNANCQSLTFENCVNNGEINGVGISAGIMANCVGPYVSMTNCVNNGTVSGATVGSMHAKNTATTLEESGCVDIGTVGGESGLASAIAQTNEGAGVRIVNDAAGSGLRFKFTMDDASIATLATLTEVYGADNVQVGAIFLPTTLVGDKALTADNFENALTMAGNASKVKDGYYYASLVNLFEANYNVEYSCQSFWRVKTSAEGEWITVYANNTLSRTVAGVAAEALNDPNKPNYSQEQLDILTAYANAQNG